MKKRLRSLALRLFLGYGLLVLVVFLVQRRLIYFPNPKKATVAGLTEWPSGEAFWGYLGEHEPDQPKGTVVVFHGNAGRAADRTYFTRALEPLGYRVILAEYPGYGGRAGSPRERTLVAEGVRVVQRVAEQWPEPVYVVGESLGCGVACAVVAKAGRSVRGLVLITPWDSLPDLAQAHYPFLPARWIVTDRFDSVANLATVSVPVAVLLAENDEVIPMAHGQHLYDSLTSRKRLWVFPGAGHNSWPSSPKEPWWQEVFTFLA